MTNAGRRACLDALTSYAPTGPRAADVRDRWLTLIAEHPGVTDRTDPRAHVTVSATPLSADGTRVLLCRHPRFGRWGPWGGHVDAVDADLPGALVRELTEEAGDFGWEVGGIVEVWEGPVACLPDAQVAHLDLVYAVVALRDLPPMLAAEVSAGAWFPVDDLPEPATPGLARLVEAGSRGGRAR